MPKRKRGDAKKKQANKGLELEENSQEAIEERISINDNEEEASEEPEDAIDLENNMNEDYKPIPQLDKYNLGEFDEKEYEKMTPEEKKRVDKILAERDARRKSQYGSRVPAALLAEMEEEGEEDEAWRMKRRRMMVFGEPVLQEDEYKEMENYLSQDQIKGK